MPAAEQNLIIEQGATFRYQSTWCGLSARANYTYQPFDLTNGLLMMQIRRAPGTSPYLTIISTTPTHTPSSSLILLPQTGQFEIYISAKDTATFFFTRAKYDIIFQHLDNEVTPIMRGNIIMIPGITDVSDIQDMLSQQSQAGGST